MPRSVAILGSAAFFLLAPGSVGFLLPWWLAGWQMAPAFFGIDTIRVAGVMVLVLGAVPLIESFARFALVGRGTPAPVAPTQHLVVSGFYRYVRNPMYVGVLAIVIGQALILGNVVVLAYALLVCAGFVIFVHAYEEPTLARQFGDDYRLYCANVPRWIPRLTPWNSARPE